MAKARARRIKPHPAANADEDAQIPAPIRQLAERVLKMDPAILLVIGPRGVGVLRDIRDRHTVQIYEVVVLAEAMDSAVRRGMTMAGRFSKPQRRQLRRLAADAETMATYLQLLVMPREEMVLLAERWRQSNPAVEVNVILEPRDEAQRLLVHRVAGIYKPVFRYEPELSTQDRADSVVMNVKGDDELVRRLLGILQATLDANSYRGTWKAMPSRRLAERRDNLKKRLSRR